MADERSIFPDWLTNLFGGGGNPGQEAFLREGRARAAAQRERETRTAAVAKPVMDAKIRQEAAQQQTLAQEADRREAARNPTFDQETFDLPAPEGVPLAAYERATPKAPPPEQRVTFNTLDGAKQMTKAEYAAFRKQNPGSRLVSDGKQWHVIPRGKTFDDVRRASQTTQQKVAENARGRAATKAAFAAPDVTSETPTARAKRLQNEAMRASTFGTPEYEARRKAMEAANAAATEDAKFQRDLDIGNARRAWNYRNEAEAPAKLDADTYRNFRKARKEHFGKVALGEAMNADPETFNRGGRKEREAVIAKSRAWLAEHEDPAFATPTSQPNSDAWATQFRRK